MGEFSILMVLPESRLCWLVCSLTGLRNQRQFRTTTAAAEGGSQQEKQGRNPRATEVGDQILCINFAKYGWAVP